jgi:protein-S-isoprenylcysteine O-methyltransferase Ste14
MARQFISNRILPAVLFGALAFVSLSQLAQRLADPATELYSLRLAYSFLSIAYLTMLAVLFVFRRASIGQRASISAIAIAIGGTFTPLLIALQPHTINDWRVLTASDLLMLIGVLFTIYALGTLGRCFGLAAEARGLVTGGPYRVVRNPAYLSEFVTVIGMTLPLLSPLTVLIFAIFTTLQLRRIALEERVLSATFPEYEEYRSCTPALVPWPLLRQTQLRPGST